MVYRHPARLSAIAARWPTNKTETPLCVQEGLILASGQIIGPHDVLLVSGRLADLFYRPVMSGTTRTGIRRGPYPGDPFGYTVFTRLCGLRHSLRYRFSGTDSLRDSRVPGQQALSLICATTYKPSLAQGRETRLPPLWSTILPWLARCSGGSHSVKNFAKHGNP